MNWLETNYWIPEDDAITGEKGPRPIRLEQYHKDCLREALRRDEEGKFVYSTVLWSDIKKSIKSSIAAGIALWVADQKPWAEIYLIANDLKQADSRVGMYARRAVSFSPYLKKRYRTVRNNIIGKNHSVIQAIPIDPEGEAGSNADFIQFSELHGAKDDAKARMWAELTLSPTKFGYSQRWVETYAGYEEESQILYELWERGVRYGELLWPDRLYPVTNGAPAPLEAYRNGRMFCLWNTLPRCPWQTPDYYAAEAEVLTPSEFDRMHRNQWSRSTDTFVPQEWWNACQHATDFPSPDTRQSMVVALDAAVSDDTFGIIMCGRHPDRKNYPDDAVVYYARYWTPPQGGRIDFQGTPENPGPELELRRLIKEYNVVEVAYDQYQLHDMASRLYREGLAYFRQFPQGSGKHSRLIADSDLRDKIRDRRIWHNGNPMLTEHVMNANAKIDPEDRKIRIVKRVEHLKIDLAVCLSMASYEVFRLNL